MRREPRPFCLLKFQLHSYNVCFSATLGTFLVIQMMVFARKFLMQTNLFRTNFCITPAVVFGLTDEALASGGVWRQRRRSRLYRKTAEKRFPTLTEKANQFCLFPEQRVYICIFLHPSGCEGPTKQQTSLIAFQIC